MEAEISEVGSVESGNVRKNPQAGESGGNASSEDCVGNNGIANTLLR